MSRYWVLEQLFKLQAAYIDWSAEARKLNYEGPQQPATTDPAPVQLRWLLHPALGLPREPFVVWKNHHPGGNPTAQQLSELPGWEQVETVGLPVDASWTQSHYALGPQGLTGHPQPPIAAAGQRLERGAPRIGWTRLIVNLAIGPVSLPDWEPVDIPAYLHDVVGGRLVHGLRDMLQEEANAGKHAAYTKKDSGNAFKPVLLTGVSASDPGEARGEWHPLGLLLLSAGSDPLASLALGFGTAVHEDEGTDLYMVTVKHTIRFAGQSHDVHLADVVIVNRQLPAPSPPMDVSAGLIGHTRPQATDGPAVDSIAVSWRRPLNPLFAQLGSDAPFAIAYAVGRFDRLDGQILLTRRPSGVHGWKPFVASKPDQVAPVRFVDHRERLTNFGAELVADSLGEGHQYAVAAADIFGRWSGWTTTPYTDVREPARTPPIFAASIAPDGKLTVDFGWDWSDRSPQFIELLVSYHDAPHAPLLTARLDFAGAPTPTLTVTPVGNASVEPLSFELELLPAGAWGAAQDKPGGQAENRFYRLHAATAFAFGGMSARGIEVRACGQTHIDERMVPGYNIGAFGPPFAATAYDPAPPGRPELPPPPEHPQWATLRDSSGVSRAIITWPSVPNAAGYVLYEATETTLLAGLLPPHSGPDTTEAFTSRLMLLRNADLQSQRRNFRRVRKELISAASHEIELPRGSTVMHFYAVTAVNANQIESAWPPNSKQFIAVAAPRTRVPPAPSLEATLVVNAGGPTVQLHATIDPLAAVATVELYRVHDDELATSVDTMGLPIASVPPTGADAKHTDAIQPSWRRAWYRAVAWSARDDLNGYVEARSDASAAVPILAPPNDPPAIADVRVNEGPTTREESLVSWTTNAPYELTPLGGHQAIVETYELGGTLIRRLEGRLDTLAKVATPAAVPAPTVSRTIVHVANGPGNRLYAWLHRPDPDQAIHLSLKMIDPLGRIGHLELDVPPIPPTPAPTVTSVDPQSGHTGDQFTITGTNLVVHAGDDVAVLFVGPLDVLGTQDEQSITCTIVQPTSPSSVTVEVPDPISSHHDSEEFEVTLIRSDGAQVKVLDDFFLAIL